MCRGRWWTVTTVKIAAAAMEHTGRQCGECPLGPARSTGLDQAHFDDRSYALVAIAFPPTPGAPWRNLVFIHDTLLVAIAPSFWPSMARPPAQASDRTVPTGHSSAAAFGFFITGAFRDRTARRLRSDNRRERLKTARRTCSMVSRRVRSSSQVFIRGEFIRRRVPRSPDASFRCGAAPDSGRCRIKKRAGFRAWDRTGRQILDQGEENLLGDVLRDGRVSGPCAERSGRWRSGGCRNNRVNEPSWPRSACSSSFSIIAFHESLLSGIPVGAGRSSKIKKEKN